MMETVREDCLLGRTLLGRTHDIRRAFSHTNIVKPKPHFTGEVEIAVPKYDDRASSEESSGRYIKDCAPFIATV
jgi:hypothetical protein